MNRTLHNLTALSQDASYLSTQLWQSTYEEAEHQLRCWVTGRLTDPRFDNKHFVSAVISCPDTGLSVIFSIDQVTGDTTSYARE